MQTLPPLPLVDNGGSKALLIDNSTIELLRCPRLLELQWLRKRVLSSNKAGRNFGSTLHAGWAKRYEYCGANAVSDMAAILINDTMQQYLAKNPQPEGDFRNFEHAVNMMAAYNENYQNEPFVILSTKDGKPLIESSFCLPFGKVNDVDIYYTGKIDLGIENCEGVWSQDHKTTFQFGDTFDKQMSMDGGQLGYLWALKKITGKSPQGYIIDAVRVRRPTVKSQYGGASCIDATDFKRMPFYKTADDLDEWAEDTIRLVARIFTMHRDGYFPRHRWQCTNKFGSCDMFEVCSMPKASREHALQSSLFEDNDWSPLKSAWRRLEVGETIKETDVSWPKEEPFNEKIALPNSPTNFCSGYQVESTDKNYYYRKIK